MEQVNPQTGEIVEVREDQSATIGELAAALAKAQGEMKPANEGDENPYFKSSYADLTSVWAACRTPLSKNGLAVIQSASSNEGRVVVTTTLAHSSGEWIRGRLTLKPTKDDPQGVGSAITYGRRYGLSAMVGVTSSGDDDDGNQASDPKKVQKPKEKVSEFITTAQRNQLYKACEENGVLPATAKAYLEAQFGIKSADTIKKVDFQTVMQWISDQNPDNEGKEVKDA